MKTIHATSVSISGIAVLIRGEPAAGKSDMGLRLIDEGAKLIADDYTNLIRRGRELIASPPPKIAGKIEVRGLGIIELPYASGIKVGLVVDLVSSKEMERLPEAEVEEFEGVKVRRIRLDPFQISATAKLRLAARQSPMRR